MPILNNYLNITEVAELLDIHPGTVKRLCREGKLAGEKVHNGWLIHTDILEAFAKSYNGHRGRPPNRARGEKEPVQK